MADAAPIRGGEDPVLASPAGPVLTLTLNRPDRLNAVDLGLYTRLAEALAEAGTDGVTRCVVVTGAGRAFCAGADLKAHAEAPPTGAERERYAEAAQEANRAVQESALPVLAAVNGHAIGAGLELALSCDFVIVAEEAKLRLPEIALGTFVGGGVTYTLPERVGTAVARRLLYFGDFFSGAEAGRLGVADQVLPSAEVLPTALSWAERLAGQAPRSLAAVKLLLRSASRAGRSEAMADEARVLEALFGTEDWREGIRAHREGRAPRFTGR